MFKLGRAHKVAKRTPADPNDLAHKMLYDSTVAGTQAFLGLIAPLVSL